MNDAKSGKLPSALEKQKNIIDRLKKGRPAIFLDYDGTLTPIVEDPAKALLPAQTREMLKKLSEHWTVVIMTGRALQDIRNIIDLDNMVYAGSHGFNMLGPEESFHDEMGKEFLPDLDKAEKEIRNKVKGLEGVRIERKPYAIAIHYRQAIDEIVPHLEKFVDEVANHYEHLVKTTGKKIFELRPKAEWDKGKALLYLLKKLHIDESRTVPLYIGDDTTDEDAFQAISKRGIGIRVTDNNQATAAIYTLRNPSEVSLFIERLVDEAEKESSMNVWSLSYDSFIPEKEQLREALCTLGNGYFATRGAAPETIAGPFHYPGTYMAGLYNRLCSNVDGYTIENESLVNIPNWLPLSFRLEDSDWFDAASVNILNYHQELNIREGVLFRTIRFEDDKKRRTTIIQRRFVHMAYKHLAGLETAIRAENWSGKVCIRSALDGRVENSLVERYQKLNNHHLTQLDTGVTDDGLIWLQVETNQSHIRIAETALTTLFYDNQEIKQPGKLIKEDGYIGQEFYIDVQTGQTLRVEKTVSVYNSRDSAISESLIEAQAAVRHGGSFIKLMDRHTIAWSHLWERWCIKIQAHNPRIEQILNLHIFHLLQTVSPHSVDLDVGVPPRGLHGEAYRGLIMWDELFIFPLLNLRIPDITRSLLMYRYRRLPRAKWAAAQANSEGAMFPWQSGSNGQEQAQTLHLNPASGRWIPDNSQLERHINIAIAYNIWQYYQVTGDHDFMSFYGAELIFEIARFWANKVQYNPSTERYEIHKVMGPDEFHDSYPDSPEPGVDNNSYTNVMVAWLFWRATEILDKLPGNRRQFITEDLSLKQEELDHWNDIARKMLVVFHDNNIISQFEKYGELKEFNWDGYRKKYGDIQRLDRILEAEGDSPNRYKLSKQADVLMLFYLLSADEIRQLFDRLGYPFKYETIPENVEYYLKRTSHGSTLSRVVHAWVLARSKREMSWRLFQDALESDIDDIQGGTTHEGIHLGAMAGTVDLILRCYSGIESRGEVLWFNPSLPAELKSLEFNVRYRTSQINVTITAGRIKLASLSDGGLPVEIGLGDKTFLLKPGDVREMNL